VYSAKKSSKAQNRWIKGQQRVTPLPEAMEFALPVFSIITLNNISTHSKDGEYE